MEECCLAMFTLVGSDAIVSVNMCNKVMFQNKALITQFTLILVLFGMGDHVMVQTGLGS